MVQTTKKTTATKKGTQPAIAETPKPAALETAGAAKKTKKEATPAIAESKPETVDDKVNEIVDDSLGDQFSDFMGKLQSVSAAISALKSDFRILEKKCLREMKTAKKLSDKRSRARGQRAPSGFVKPTLVTNDLADFLGKPHGTEMARTEVTREINKYIRANSLQDAQNGRKINPDDKLAKLLNLKKSDELTYFNLQRYMSPHFPKSAAATAATAAK
jgi:chromatin remodeling complex protein RSC6